MDRAGEIFACDPNNPPTELVQCSLCEATFPVEFLNDLANLSLERCPKCPERKDD